MFGHRPFHTRTDLCRNPAWIFVLITVSRSVFASAKLAVLQSDEASCAAVAASASTSSSGDGASSLLQNSHRTQKLAFTDISGAINGNTSDAQRLNAMLGQSASQVHSYATWYSPFTANRYNNALGTLQIETELKGGVNGTSSGNGSIAPAISLRQLGSLLRIRVVASEKVGDTVSVLLGIIVLLLFGGSLISLGVYLSSDRDASVPRQAARPNNRFTSRDVYVPTRLSQQSQASPPRPSLSPAPRSSIRVPATESDLSVGFSPSEWLCPELVVPEFNECTFIVPALPFGNEASLGGPSPSISVVDTRGGPVLSLSLRTNTQGIRSLVLAGESNKQVFAIATENETGDDITIADRQNNSYASFKLQQVWVSGSVFALQTSSGRTITFNSDSTQGTVNAMAEDTRLLAIVERSGLAAGPHGQSRTLIIGPLSDAGLFVLCLGCLDMMSRRTASRVVSRER